VLKNLRALIAALPFLLAAVVLAGIGMVAYPLMSCDRIYPGIAATGVDVGGLTTEEAAAYDIGQPAHRIQGVAPGTPVYRDESPLESEVALAELPPDQAADSEGES
jgi:hypothetical protein